MLRLVMYQFGIPYTPSKRRDKKLLRKRSETMIGGLVARDERTVE
jgi:hypothetical protein